MLKPKRKLKYIQYLIRNPSHHKAACHVSRPFEPVPTIRPFIVK